MIAINVAEVLDILLRRERLPDRDVDALITPLLGQAIEVMPLSVGLAWTAARLRTAHHHRKTRPLSIPDCVALAAALPIGRLATADRPLAAAARREGIAVVALPDSNGKRP